MKVLGRDKLIKFSKKHANAKGALEAWYDEADEADWKTPQDIKNRYRSADILPSDKISNLNKVIFNIKGNHYRLVVAVRFQQGIVVVEWVGTHAEYDKQQF